MSILCIANFLLTTSYVFLASMIFSQTAIQICRMMRKKIRSRKLKIPRLISAKMKTRSLILPILMRSAVLRVRMIQVVHTTINLFISRIILASKPPSSTQKDLKSKSKESNRGFKTAPDGRLIIEDIEDQVTDSDDDDMTGYKDKAKKKVYDEESDDEKDGPSKKKFALNSYQAGGSGIHRPLAASVKSGRSNHSKSSKISAVSRNPGSEYKSSKSGGDLKKKGKHEPYAYVALSRNSLNRRKRSKGVNQFKGISNKSKGKKGKA